MKNIKKIISCTVLCTVLIFVLCSCNSISKQYKDAGADLPKDSVFTSISESSLINMLETEKSNDEKNEIIYLFYGTPDSTECQTAVVQYNEQALQYHVDKIYHLSSTKYNNSEKRKELQEKLGMNDASKICSIMVFVDGVISFDSSKQTTANKYNSISKISTYIFKDIPKNLE